VYTKNTAIATPDTLSDSATTLVIDQASYTNWEIDDCDAAQINANIMDAAMAESSYSLADSADQYIAAQMVANVAAGNKIGTDVSPIVPGTSTGTTMYDYIVDIATKLNEANAPKVGRWIILPPWCTGLVYKDDRFMSVAASGSSDVIKNGHIARISGFDVLESNNVPNTEGELYKIVAGCTSAVAYAESINDVEAYRPELAFSDAVKCLHFYGVKVVRPSALALLTASKTA
jgi:N4-gp56 family major capsid protein